jgi:hypothetical protein
MAIAHSTVNSAAFFDIDTLSFTIARVALSAWYPPVAAAVPAT